MAPNNLPVLLTSFIGREREAAEVERLLTASRLVTLTGAGGCGKTRLALHVATSLADAFADGVWLVEFTSLNDPALVPPLVAQVLGIHLAPDLAPLESVADFVQNKHLLLILDNCEHLREACAQVARSLVSTEPRTRILATSRETLDVEDETVYQVTGLALPRDRPEGTGVVRAMDAPPPPFGLEALQQYDAIRLFVERARGVVPSFGLTPDNGWHIAEICRRLDGIPLAIELASARMNVLTVQQVAQRLDNRFALLTSRQPTARVPYHRTLREAIDWSYDLLSAAEQTVLRRLSVFGLDCALEAAEAICSGDGIEPDQVLDTLSSLVSKSLVVADTLTYAQARYRLLESVREYALQKLNQAGETKHARDRHLEYYVGRAEDIAPKLRGPYLQPWLNWLESEHGNLRAALAWSLDGRQIELGLRLSNALYQFWETRGSLQEGRDWLEQLLAYADEHANGNVSLVIRANAATYAAFFAGFLGDSAAAQAHGRAAVALSEAAGDAGKPALAFALGGMVSGASASGDYMAAYEIGERCMQLYRELGDPFGLCIVLMNQATHAVALGKYDIARPFIEESLSIARELNTPYLIGNVLNGIGDLARCDHEDARARSAYEESLSYFREYNSARDTASVLHNLAYVLLHQGEVERARSHLQESVRMQLAQGNRQGIAECMTGVAAVAVAYGRPTVAAHLLGAAVALGGASAFLRWPAERMEYEQCLAAVRAQLTPEEFERAQEEGRALIRPESPGQGGGPRQAGGSRQALEMVVEHALNLLGPPAPQADDEDDEPQHTLTAREVEVATLIAQGKSNGEIAERLILSKRTVEKHVGSILSKLDFTTRAQVVRWAIENGLLQASA